MDATERRDRASAEAAHWWTQLGHKAPTDVSETDRREYTAWLRESPLHIAAMLRIAQIDESLREFPSWAEIPSETEVEQGNVVLLAPPSRSARHNNTLPRKRNTLSRLAWAATVAAVAICIGWLLLQARGTVLTTDRAERREVMLADGSMVSLEPETRLRVSLSKSERRLTLEHGRALFRVAQDATRPFLVTSAGTVIRAVGTVFGVEEADKDVIVTVKEGRVQVLQTETPMTNTPGPGQARAVSDPTRSGVFLSSNQQITVSTLGASGPVRAVDATRALAWSEGLLVFNSTPLSQVATRINQYNRVQIRIGDPDLGRRTVSGVFQASDPQTLVDFIRAGARVTVTRPSDSEIVVSTQGSAPP